MIGTGIFSKGFCYSGCLGLQRQAMYVLFAFISLIIIYRTSPNGTGNLSKISISAFAKFFTKCCAA